MSAVKLTDGIYSVGIQNPNMRVFDIVMQTDSGTTYNSYIVRGSEKTALIETCHDRVLPQTVLLDKKMVDIVSRSAPVAAVQRILLLIDLRQRRLNERGR